MHGTIYGTGFAITPSDSQNLPTSITGIYVGGAGAVTIETLDGVVVTFAAVPVGTILPIQARKVHASLTTATLLIGLVS